MYLFLQAPVRSKYSDRFVKAFNLLLISPIIRNARSSSIRHQVQCCFANIYSLTIIMIKLTKHSNRLPTSRARHFISGKVEAHPCAIWWALTLTPDCILGHIHCSHCLNFNFLRLRSKTPWTLCSLGATWSFILTVASL